MIDRMRVLFLVGSTAACGSQDVMPHSEEQPAHIDNPVVESQLATVRLSAQAAQRIGIVLDTIERRVVPSFRTLGGDVVVPPGGSITVSAPIAGTVVGGMSLRPGERVQAGQPMLSLVALPAEGDLIRVQQDLGIANARAVLARLTVERMERLFQDSLISEAVLDTARAGAAEEEAGLRAAQARVDLLAGGQKLASGQTMDLSQLSPVTITAPRTGIAYEVHVADGQTVASGAPLFRIVDMAPLWIRVPVYVGDLASVATERPASVRTPGGASFTVRTAPAPPSADPVSVSADVYYMLPNTNGAFRPGERLTVQVPLETTESALVVSRAAIVVDVYGGSWVYVAAGDLTYVRQRVEVVRVAGDDVVIDRGPSEGTVVVKVGAAELFSTEFGPAGH